MAEIFSEDFKSLDEARIKIESFNLGLVRESESGIQTLQMLDQDAVVVTDNIYFTSETNHAYYQYTIEKHVGYCKLRIFETGKNKMINAAKTGNLIEFKKSFTDTDKMKEFSLSTAITNGHWNIVEYLLHNYKVSKDPVWEAIRWNKVEILKNLLADGFKLPDDWLAYCIYSDSLDVAKELVLHNKKHLNYPEKEIRTKWFDKEILKDTETARLVKQNIN